jgi:hypothetical protein
LPGRGIQVPALRRKVVPGENARSWNSSASRRRACSYRRLVPACYARRSQGVM